MATEIKVPSVGESISEGTVARWLKKDGEQVEVDEPLLELETEKATTEVAAPVSGTLHIAVAEGKTVAIGAVVGTIEEGSEAPARKESKKPSPASHAESEEPSSGQDGKKPPPPHAEPEAPSAPAKARVPDGHASDAALSPSVRRLVREKHVDVRELAGTGPGGRITREDVLDHLKHEAASEKTPPAAAAAPAKAAAETPARPTTETPPKAPPPVPAERETRQRMSAIRQRIAERLVAVQNTAAILTTFNEADMSQVIALRERFKDDFKKKHGVGLSFMSFFVKATVEALRVFPIVNARIDGEDIVYHNYHDIGVAVSTEKGLMVPVLHDADRLSFAEIEHKIAELAQKARDGKISIQDLQGGTFTITNGGVFGSLLSTPILNPPQSGILGMHAIQRRPIAVDDQVVIRPMMYLCFSYDHRLIDGREAVQFLVRVKECIEKPERIMLEV